MAAARAAGRDDLKITTEDLGKNVAIALAKNELIVGLGAQRAVRPGRHRGQAGAGALLGKRRPLRGAERPARDHDNVLDAWKQVYHADPPADVMNSFQQ